MGFGSVRALVALVEMECNFSFSFFNNGGFLLFDLARGWGEDGVIIGA